MRRIVLVGVLAAILAGGYMFGESHRLHIVERGQPYVRTYSRVTHGLAASMAVGDGQAYGALAQDPTMARPGVFVDGRGDAAYRYQRPLLGYVAWAISLGHPEWEPGAQAAAVILGAGVAVAACGEMLRRRRREPLLALVVLVTPGMLSALQGLTAEPIALAFLGLGLLAWFSTPQRVGLAALWFALATLSRESSLIALAALALVEILRVGRSDCAGMIRRLLPLAAPFVVYAAWVGVLRARLGAWPFAGREARLSRVPFGGLVHALSRFADPRASWFWLLAALVLVVLGVARRRDVLSAVVIAYGLFGVVIGPAVWQRWEDFSRPLLPLYAFGYLILLTWIAPAEVARA